MYRTSDLAHHTSTRIIRNRFEYIAAIGIGSNPFNAGTFKPSADHQLIFYGRAFNKYKSLEITGQIEFTKDPLIDEY